MRVVVVLVIVLATGLAVAAPRERVTVAAVEMVNVPDHVRAQAVPQIESGLRSAGYEVVHGEAVCRSSGCMAGVGRALGVSAVVVGSIAVQHGNVTVTLRLFDVASSREDVKVTDLCELCATAELGERIALLASSLRARVQEQRRRREMLAGTKSSEAPSLLPRLAIGVGGAAAVVAGIYLLSRDGDGTCSSGDRPEFPDPGAVIRYPDPNNRSVFVCRDVYETTAAGIVTTGVGIVALATSAVLLVRARPQRAIEVLPVRGGGAAVRLELRW